MADSCNLQAIGNCPACEGNALNRHGEPCGPCAGQGLLLCACGNCLAGGDLKFDPGTGDWLEVVCPSARPVTDAERDAYHDDYMARWRKDETARPEGEAA